MYCSNCGNKIENNNDKYCTNCGTKLENNNSKTNDNNQTNINNNDNKNNINTNNWLKIASIILGSLSITGSLLIIFAPIAFILSIIGLILTIYSLKKDKNLPGILTNSIGLVLSIIVNIVLIIFIMNIFGTVSDKGINWVQDFYNEHWNNSNEDHYIDKFNDIITRY